MTPRGRFISFEGGEGVGKSTQIALLADRLRAEGRSVIVTREPGGTPNAEAIRALLMTGDDDRWSAEAEALLFAAARSDHVSKLIVPALERGAWVLCDRFVDSSRAYQGAGGRIDDATVLALHAVGSGGLLPDMTLLLTTDRAVAEGRLLARGTNDRMGSKPSDYQQRVADAFLAFAEEAPERFRIIDGAGTQDAVAARIWDVVSSLSDGPQP